MSTRIMALCWPLDLPSPQKFVLISLADQANDDGVCWPSVRNIAERTCLSERSVQNAIRALMSAGLISRTWGDRKTPFYTVVPPQEMHPGVQEVHPAGAAPRTTFTPQELHLGVQETTGGGAGDDGEGCTSCTRSVKNHQDPSNTFALFWSAYPKKRSKGNAEKAWKKLAPDEQLIATILAAIEQAKKSKAWLKDGGDFIPYPASWLNAKGWEDELEPAGSGRDTGPQYQEAH